MCSICIVDPICPKPARESKAVETDFKVGAYTAAGGDNELILFA